MLNSSQQGLDKKDFPAYGSALLLEQHSRLAQLVRAPPLQGGGPRFESVNDYQISDLPNPPKGFF